MVKGQGAHACSADCFKVDKGGMKNWYIYINGKKFTPQEAEVNIDLSWSKDQVKVGT